MTEFRERTYSQFNILVHLGTGDIERPWAGFQEVSGMNMEISVTDYRHGTEKDKAPRKINGSHKVPNVTFKRGVIGSLELHEWLDQVRTGAQAALGTITVHLQNEDHSCVAQEWKLINARLIKYTEPSLNAKGNDVAVEELVLTCEGIELSQAG
jgi:phage tail-like protein